MNNAPSEIGSTSGKSAALPAVTPTLQLLVYGIGSLSNSANFVSAVIIPFWAIAIGASPFMIGMIVGARFFLTTLLSIHGGAMMDRLGTRRILIFSGLIATVSPLLFPLMPWVWAAIILQMIGGLASNYGTIGGQAIFGEIMKGAPVYAGRFAFTLRIGQLVAPPLAGLAWDLGGAWGGFAILALWGLAQTLAAIWLPKNVDGPVATETAPQKLDASAMVPRLSDYIETFRLMAIPAVLLVVIITFLRMAGQGIQGSFYVVYLEGLGYTGTIIGMLVGASSLIGFAGALSIATLARFMTEPWLLIVSVGLSILLVAITPLIAASVILLLIASAIRGGAMGLSQPLMMTIMATSAGTGNQGKGVGLRTTANRFGSLIVPIAMGAVVEVAGIEASFYVVGFALMALMLVAIRPARMSVSGTAGGRAI